MNLAALECAWKKDGAKGTVSPGRKSACSVEFLGHRVVGLGGMDDSRRIQPTSVGQMYLALQIKKSTKSRKTGGK
ncbi:MAG: hypothetical protein NTY62_06075 [Euryarchaeota archaeon]|nr:hypothetical protein [Euryarchaeota archaeon]